MREGAQVRALLAAVAVLLLVPAPAAAAPGWFAGDGHVHTCHSHDAWCGPGEGEEDKNPAFYSFGGRVDQRFAEAAAKGLDFLVISDHDNVLAHDDPAFGSAGVTGIHAYEASLDHGHAQMLGALGAYPEGDGEALGTNAMADALRLDGGLFQANHPAYRLAGTPPQTCEDVASDTRMHWQYDFQVLPDTIEVWNATTLLQPSELYWECWLQRGARIGALAGSDSHGANHANIAFPMTWAFAGSANEPDILAAFRAGRTTLSRVAPNQGAVRLILEGDRNRDGEYESMIGDQVPPGTPLRVRAEHLPGPGLVRVRANGTTAIDGARLAPGGTVELAAPTDPGWARATLYLQSGTASEDPGCEPPEDPFTPPVSTCSEDFAIAAMTSPIWVGPAAASPRVDPGGPLQETSHEQEPDSQPPLGAVEQSGGTSRLPDVPPQRGRAARVSRLRAVWFRPARRRAQRVRLSWSSPEGPFEVQARRAASRRWRTLRETFTRRVLIVRLRRGTWTFRVRARPPLAEPGPWASARARLGRNSH
jgi:hypothetical protein